MLVGASLRRVWEWKSGYKIRKTLRSNLKVAWDTTAMVWLVSCILTIVLTLLRMARGDWEIEARLSMRQSC